MLYNCWNLYFTRDNKIRLSLDKKDDQDYTTLAEKMIVLVPYRAFVYFERKDAETNAKYRKKLIEACIKEVDDRINILQERSIQLKRKYYGDQ